MDNKNMELDDEMMAAAQGGLNVEKTEDPKFSVGDTVSFRAVDEAGNQGFRVGRITEVDNDNEGWGYKYTVDTADDPIYENSLIQV